MANKKISQLPNATTPLSGTEPLPVVQSNVTVQATVNDIKSINLQYSGIDLSANDYTISGPGAYTISVGSGSGNLIFPDPSLYPGQLILIDTIDAGSASNLDNSNTFAPVGSGVNGSLEYGFLWIIYSINNRWVTGLFYY